MDEKIYTTPKSCERFFKKCSANICPLEVDWQLRTHVKGERVCFYMTEAEKIDAEAVFRDSGRIQLYIAIKDVSPKAASCHYPIKYALEQAKKTGLLMNRQIARVEDGKK